MKDKRLKKLYLLFAIGIVALLISNCSRSERFVEKGKQYLEIGDHEKAIEQFDKAIDKSAYNLPSIQPYRTSSLFHVYFGYQKLHQALATSNISSSSLDDTACPK